MRVITLKTKNKFYSKNYYYYRLPHTQSASPRSPRRRDRSIFFSAPYYIQTNPPKKPHPHRWRVSPSNHSVFRDPPKAGSPKGCGHDANGPENCSDQVSLRRLRTKKLHLKEVQNCIWSIPRGSKPDFFSPQKGNFCPTQILILAQKSRKIVNLS